MWLCRESKAFRCVGNGGLSLWRREVLLERVADPSFMKDWGTRDHLDVYFAQHLQASRSPELHGYEASPAELEAARFSVEGAFFFGGGFVGADTLGFASL